MEPWNFVTVKEEYKEEEEEEEKTNDEEMSVDRWVILLVVIFLLLSVCGINYWTSAANISAVLVYIKQICSG